MPLVSGTIKYIKRKVAKQMAAKRMKEYEPNPLCNRKKYHIKRREQSPYNNRDFPLTIIIPLPIV